MDPVLAPEALSGLSDPVLLDARPGEAGRRAFLHTHLAGAHHVELDADLSAAGTDPSRGGRHPLPDVAAFCALLGRLGVRPGREVVVYDAATGALAAARAWWMLRALGHERVFVLDGGLAAAVSLGLATASGEAPPPEPAPSYPAAAWGLPTATLQQVEVARKDPDTVVIDVRAPERFRGEVEPLDPVAGHIDGAVNRPYADNLDGAGRFRSAAELRSMYADLREKDVVVHCGSGVTACHTLLALERAGLPTPALYVGSWSEWCRVEGTARQPA